MRSIATSITIAAPADKIWEVLTDTDKWSEWNPFFDSLRGTLAVDEHVVVNVRHKNMKLKPKILVSNPGQELRWVGKLASDWVFTGEHHFIITDQGDGTCLFDHGERFHGCMVPVMGLLSSLFQETEASFNALNRALKERCEKQ
jgi:hypothetical protein